MWILRTLWDALTRRSRTRRRTRQERRSHERLIAGIVDEVAMAKRERIDVEDLRAAVSLLTENSRFKRSEVLDMVAAHGLDGASKILGVGQ